MKNTTYISPQTQPKSIKDLTPYELAVIDDFQNRNRGFEDDDDEDNYNCGLPHDSDCFWED